MPTAHSLKSIRLINYKGFADNRISFRRANILVGANNAGKSTALGALRLIVAMLPQAGRVNPSQAGLVNGVTRRGWPLTLAAVDAAGFSAENLRHDFRPVETRIEVLTSSGVILGISWPGVEYEDEPAPGGLFYVLPGDNAQSPRDCVRELIPVIGSVPTLTPLDDTEAIVSSDTLRAREGGRRSSRYFRNTLNGLSSTDWIAFTSYVYEKTPELTNLAIRRAYGDRESNFDFFYSEPDTGHEREFGWSGDGMQIWVQLLFHLWKHRNSHTVLLDEPDVFLHPDLQRRLARILFEGELQTIIATHSVEILAEADPGSAVWVDRSRRNAERPRADGSLAMMGRRLGSGFELGIGRALRSNAVLFVEGNDAPILAHIARASGRREIARADAFATVPMGGYSRNWTAAAFSETMAALGHNIRTLVLLDSDLRSRNVIMEQVAPLLAAGAAVHVWQRRELENYLLVPGVISRISGLPLADTKSLLDDCLGALEDEAELALQTQRLQDKPRDVQQRTVLAESKIEFRREWNSEDGPVRLVDAKAVITQLNIALQTRGKKTLNAHSLARNMRLAELPDEVAEVLDKLDFLVAPS